MKKALALLVVAAGIFLWAGSAPALAAEPDRITDDTTVLEVERQIMAVDNPVIEQTTITLGGQERISIITMTAAGVSYTLVMEFIYQPFETEDGKWGYPCIGVNRYLTRK